MVEDDDTTQDVTEDEIHSLVEVDETTQRTGEHPKVIIPASEDRRSTFTFTVDSNAAEDLPDHESLDGHEATEEAALTNFFRSPIKGLSADVVGSPEKVFYPRLPQSDDAEMEMEIADELIAETEEPGKVEEEDVEAAVSGYRESDDVALEAEIREEAGTAHTGPDSPVLSTEIVYPALPILSDASNCEGEDAEMLETTSEVSGDEASDIEGGDEAPAQVSAKGDSDEDFTEATLQLAILREYAEAREKNHPVAPVSNDESVQSRSSGPDEAEPRIGTDIDIIMDCGPVVEEVSHDTEISGAEEVEPQAYNELDEAALQSPPRASQGDPEAQVDDITDGLTLSFTPARVASVEPTPRKLHSPPPPPRAEFGPDDATMTIAIDDDTAILKEFLNRAAASKAEKAATHRRESLQNRRDSDVIRHALASPRKVLEDKDPNSPSKYDNELTLDLSQALTLSMPNQTLSSPALGSAEEEGTAEEKSLGGSRRSSRAKRSRLPAPASLMPPPAQTSKIAIRRNDGNELVVLRKSDAQELATLTRANTRKNKQGAFGVSIRLFKLTADAASLPPIDDSTKELVIGKNIRWDEQLAYYQEDPMAAANAIAEAESLATPDELSMPGVSFVSKTKNKISKNSTPKIRRVRGLGSANGTPGKGLLAPAAFLPDSVQEEKEPIQAPTPHLPRPKASKIKKMPVASTSIDSSVSSNPTETRLPTLDVAPVGVAVTPQRKSRLAAPKKVVLPQAGSSGLLDGKENAQRKGVSDATPKKGISAPKMVVSSSTTVPAAGMESGLPRRRGRKY